MHLHLRPLIALVLAAVLMAVAALAAPADPGARAGSSEALTYEPARSAGLVLLSGRGGVPPTIRRAIEQVHGFDVAASRTTTTAGITGSVRADGTPVDTPPPGYAIPLSIAVVEPSSYGTVLGADLGSLSASSVVLSERGAALRGLDVGDRMTLDGPGVLTISAVVPEELALGVEALVHLAHAEALDVADEHGGLLVRHSPLTPVDRAGFVAALGRRLPSGTSLRVRAATTAAGLAEDRLVLSLAEVKERFGEFAYAEREGVRPVDLAPGFESRHIVRTEVPVLGRVRCHEAIIADLRDALARIEREGRSDAIDPDRYAGCFYARRVSTSGPTLSHHSWGIALDINVDLDLPGLGEPPDPGVIAAFEDHGFVWGGRFIPPDNHHFEWVGRVGGPPTTARIP